MHRRRSGSRSRGCVRAQRRVAIATFVYTSEFGTDAATLFRWHSSQEALETLIPPWEPVEVERAPASLRDGETAVLVIRLGPLRQKWVALHRDYVDRGEAGGEFTDEQVEGPFARWVHRHLVEAVGPRKARLEDRIDYALPLGPIGQAAAGWLVRRKLRRMFEYRHRVTGEAVSAERSAA